MIIKNLTVGKGLQAYRLFSQGSAAPAATSDIAGGDVHRIFFDRLMKESERVAQRSASPDSPPHD
jgi:hypothetical protein